MNKNLKLFFVTQLFLLAIFTPVIADIISARTSTLHFESLSEVDFVFPGGLTIPFYFPPNTSNDFNDLLDAYNYFDYVEVDFHFNAHGDRVIDGIKMWNE
jgi:hypothetical protein